MQFPVWIIKTEVAAKPATADSCEMPGHALAFSTPDKATRFLAARKSGAWHLSLVDSLDGLWVLIADLHSAKVAGICLDPHSDGSGGVWLSLQDLFEAVERLRNP